MNDNRRTASVSFSTTVPQPSPPIRVVERFFTLNSWQFSEPCPYTNEEWREWFHWLDSERVMERFNGSNPCLGGCEFITETHRNPNTVFFYVITKARTQL